MDDPNRPEAIADEIVRILNLPTQGGAFRHSDHSCSWPAGVGQALRAKTYRERLGPLPGWVMEQHPNHIALLCDLALDRGVRLPDLHPTDLDECAQLMVGGSVPEAYKRRREERDPS